MNPTDGLRFGSPAWLALLVVLPWLWWQGRRLARTQGRVRAGCVLLARSLVVLLMVACLAEVEWVRSDRRLTVMFVVDRSLSLPAESLPRIVKFVDRATGRDRERQDDDRSGVLVFGREAAIEVAPSTEPGRLPEKLESRIDPRRTDLAAAIELAQAVLPAEGMRRIVIVSDGNENLDDARSAARSASEAGIGIDVALAQYRPRPDILVDKLTLPAEARSGEAFDVRVVLERFVADSAAEAKPVAGRMRLLRRTSEGETLVADEPITLAPGKRVFTVRQDLTAADTYTYEARFSADDRQYDVRVENNRATGFTQLRGRGQVLLVEPPGTASTNDALVAALREQKLEVRRQSTAALFNSLAELGAYDVVILADVPRTGADEAQATWHFSDQQIEMLVRNTHDLGSGLVVLGGPDSFGAGGWGGTKLEEALPVDLRIDDAHVRLNGALALVIDRSSSMTGEKLEMAKSAAIAAIKQLGPQDWVGVTAFDAAPWVVFPMQQASNPALLTRQVGRLEASGGTNMYPAMFEAYQSLAKATAAAKHMILLTDGQSPPGDERGLAARMAREKMTVSTVALGQDAAEDVLRDVARIAKGKFYRVHSPQGIPRIFMHEARRVARPLVFEDAQGFAPQLHSTHEIVRGLEAPLPSITGLLLTSAKANPLVEVPLISPRPEGGRPLLACWTYGLGRSVAWTTDVGPRWTKAWHDWPGYDRFFTQMVRWAMRPVDEADDLTVAIDTKNEQASLVVTSLDPQAGLADAAALAANVVGPGLDAQPLELAQVGPGRYVGHFATSEPGEYFATIRTNGRRRSLRVGLSVPYSSEYRDRQPDRTLLTELAALVPRGGSAGQLVELPLDEPDTAADAHEPAFRHDLAAAEHTQDAWHLAMLAAIVGLVGDVAARRLALPSAATLQAVRNIIARWRGAATEGVSPALERLQARKREVAERLRPAEPLTPPTPHEPAERAPVVEIELPPVAVALNPAKPTPPAAKPASYMDRLLEAKQRAQAKTAPRQEPPSETGSASEP